MTNAIVKYETTNGEVILDSQTVRNYLVSGNGRITDKELNLFMNLCKYQCLNPFLREAYLIKFGDRDAQIVVGKDVFVKRAYANENFKKYEAGVVVLNLKSGEIKERPGSLYAKQVEQLVGGYCRVFLSNGDEFYHTVSFDEYNSGQSTWKKLPGTMIRKVALVQALRECFPSDFQGLYDSSEMGIEETNLPATPVEKGNPTITREQANKLLKEVGKEKIVYYCKEKGYRTSAELTMEDYHKLMVQNDIEKIEPEIIEDEVVDAEIIEGEVVEHEELEENEAVEYEEDENNLFEVNSEDLPF